MPSDAWARNALVMDVLLSGLGLGLLLPESFRDHLGDLLQLLVVRHDRQKFNLRDVDRNIHGSDSSLALGPVRG